MHVQQCRVLPAAFLVRVHGLEHWVPFRIALMEVDCRGDGRHGRKQVRVAERQPQRALAAHARAQQSHPPGRQLVTLPKPREDVFAHVGLRGQFRIELRTHPVHPPARPSVGYRDGQSVLFEKPGEHLVFDQPSQMDPVQVDEAKPVLVPPRRFVQIQGMPSQVQFLPTGEHRFPSCKR